ncbi:hypothetical protein F4677DRAFT_101599 [Hypoxylon crocopeplum]|nr:hypothetical protein F4677DRAFT_101599 [Hypoxylon crocopeplum]
MKKRLSISTASTISGVSTTSWLEFPSLEKLSPDSKPFDCPTCFTTQSFRRETSWKAHVFSDLRAYVCTTVGSECGHQLFNNCNAWFDHELQFHRSKYVCPLCNEDTHDKSTLASHVKSVHGSFTIEHVTALVGIGRVVPTHFKARDCPFCDIWAEVLESRSHRGTESLTLEDGQILVSRSRFKRHVATHQEQLAIFVIPSSSEHVEYATTKIIEKDNSTSHIDKKTTRPGPSKSTGTILRRAEVNEYQSGTTVAWGTSPLARGGWGGRFGSSGASQTISTSSHWKCCSCDAGGNNSYVYDIYCLECKHKKCGYCEVWVRDIGK